MERTIERPAETGRVRLDLNEDELELIRASLHLLLVVEDDHEIIPQLKALLARIEREAPVQVG
jgi:hypothetical protein